MNGQRPDRRVTRSRRLLQDALVALILERGYAAVTVQAVLDHADVGRATFYAHFADKKALLLSLFEELRESLRHELAGITPATAARFGEGAGLLLPLFEHAARNERLYRALLGSREGAVLLHEVREAIAAPLREHLEVAFARHGREPSARVELVLTAFVSAVLGALVWWLEADMPFSPAETDLTLERLMALGMGAALDLHAGGEPGHAVRDRDAAPGPAVSSRGAHT